MLTLTTLIMHLGCKQITTCQRWIPLATCSVGWNQINDDKGKWGLHIYIGSEKGNTGGAGLRYLEKDSGLQAEEGEGGGMIMIRRAGAGVTMSGRARPGVRITWRPQEGASHSCFAEDSHKQYLFNQNDI